MANFAQLHDDMLEYELQLVGIMENLEDVRMKMVTRRDAFLRISKSSVQINARKTAIRVSIVFLMQRGIPQKRYQKKVCHTFYENRSAAGK